MITILHGDYQEASRAVLLRFLEKNRDKEIRRLDNRSISEDTLVQVTESSSLFGGGRVVVLEGVFTSLGRKQKLSETYAAILSRNAGEADIVIWEPKELSPATLKRIGQASVTVFKLPALIFKFLDAITPGGAPITIPLLADILRTEPAEIVFSMMLRRVRMLIQCRDNMTPSGLQGWQAARLTRQSASFTMDQLLELHDRLYHMDSSIKTGASPYSLAQHIQQVLIAV